MIQLQVGQKIHEPKSKHTEHSPSAVEVDLIDIPDITEDTKIALYRIAQEAFNNIAKHANAKNVYVSLRKDNGGCQLLIRDDGKGISDVNVPSNHLGMGIM